jgi:hypothetical protein
MKYCECVPRIVSDNEKQAFVAEDKLECLYLAITFQANLIFAGSTRSLPKKEASERSSDWVLSGLALKFLDLTGKDFQGQTL